ncbi:MAG TPA: DUF1499 domain-containing protein [Devosia sp.]
MRILIRTSKWAIWARRLGSFAMPLAIIPVFLHRERIISSDDFLLIELIAAGFALLAAFLGVGAYVRLWVTGDQGWSRATVGLFFSAVCLAPIAFVFWMALRYPATYDVSTNPANPPALVTIVARVMTPGQRAAAESAFPNARTRTYPIGAEQMFGIVEQMEAQKGWELRARRAPTNPLDEGTLNAIATTLLGWRDEVVVRVAGTAAGSVVDMRSAATHGWSDLGENGRRIEEFLLELDTRITLMLRDAPQTPTAPADDTATPQVQDEEAE